MREHNKNYYMKTSLTFESFAFECLSNNAGWFVLDLLSLPESFAQFFHIMSVHNICVPPSHKRHTTVYIKTFPEEIQDSVKAHSNKKTRLNHAAFREGERGIVRSKICKQMQNYDKRSPII